MKGQPDNYRFHCGLQTAILDLPPSVSLEMFALKRLELPSTALQLEQSQLEMLRQLYSKSNFESKVIKKIELTLYRGEYIKNLRENNRFDAEGGDVVQPQALLWALYLQAHLLVKSGQLDDALASINACIEHTPTAMDMICKKAEILKMRGEYQRAAETMDEARDLDLQDRYLNNKASKYWMRAENVERGMSTIAMFTKHDMDGDPQKTLFTLQVNWFELEAACSFQRTKNWAEALRKFYAIKYHFAVHKEDMFDFHGYCIRKTTLRAYMDVLHMQDNAVAHKYFQRAFRGAVGIFLHLLDVIVARCSTSTPPLPLYKP